MKRVLAQRRKPIHAKSSPTDVTGANGNRMRLLLLALAESMIVNVEELPAVTEAEEKLHEAPAGSPEQANDTDPAKPSIADTRMLAVPVPPL
jgi:hypothetical protein